MKSRQKRDYKLAINRDLCIGAGSCRIIAPETFDLDSEGKAIIKDPGVSSLEVVLEAAKACPTGAIIVRDKEGHKIYPKN